MLSPQERSLRARLAAHTLHARYSAHDLTAPAREAARTALDRRLSEEFEIDVSSPDGAKRLEHARRAYFARLALRSASARRKGGAR